METSHEQPTKPPALDEMDTSLECYEEHLIWSVKLMDKQLYEKFNLSFKEDSILKDKSCQTLLTSPTKELYKNFILWQPFTG